MRSLSPQARATHVSKLVLMNDFLNTIRNKETNAANLFIKNTRALAQGDRVEVARELTDLRVQLQETQEGLEKVETKVELFYETTMFEYFLMCLFIATLILLGIAYIYI